MSTISRVPPDACCKCGWNPQDRRQQVEPGASGFSIRPNFGLYEMLQVWESEQFSLDFLAKHPVYHDYKQHSAEIQKTRALGWYKGELFARFVPTAAKAPASGMLGKMPD